MSEELNSEKTDEEKELEYERYINKKRRVNKAFKLIALNYNSGEIAKLISEEFGVTLRTAESDIAKAKKKFKNLSEPQIERIYNECLESTNAFIKLAYEKGDIKGAATHISNKMKLTGVSAPEKHDVNVTGIEVIFKPAGEKNES